MKKSDVFLLGILIFVLALSLSAYLADSFSVGVAVGCFLDIFYVCAILLFRRKTHYQTKQDFAKSILVEGKEKSDKLIRELLGECQAHSVGVFVCDKTIVFNMIKFSGVSEEDVASIYRQSKKYEKPQIKVYMRRIEKNALSLAHSLGLDVTFCDLKKFYAELKSKSLLEQVELTKRRKTNFKTIITNIRYVPVKYFLFAAITCAVTSVFAPLKIYYLSLSIVNLALGVVVAIISRKQDKSV